MTWPLLAEKAGGRRMAIRTNNIMYLTNMTSASPYYTQACMHACIQAASLSSLSSLVRLSKV